MELSKGEAREDSGEKEELGVETFYETGNIAHGMVLTNPGIDKAKEDKAKEEEEEEEEASIYSREIQIHLNIEDNISNHQQARHDKLNDERRVVASGLENLVDTAEKVDQEE